MPKSTQQSFLEHVPRARTVWITFAVFVLFMAVGFPLWERMSAMPEDIRVLDLRFGYGPETVYTVLGDLGPEGRSAYVRSLTMLDVAWPLAYGAFLTVLPAYTFSDLPARRRRWLVAIPVLGVVFDYFENLSILALLVRYPVRIEALAWAAATLTTVKWVFVTGAMILAATCGVVLLVRMIGAGREGRDAPT